MTRDTVRPVLLTGATGFVGRNLRVALKTAGVRLRLGSRNEARARQRDPSGEWAHFDIEEPDSMRAALEGCRAAYFLVHRIGASADYPMREAEAARAFSEAAASAALERVVYLGGVAPAGTPSQHLQSRITTGEILRAGEVPTVELRAAMVIGCRSTSWQMVRDLARRLPAMVLPRWLRRHSWPIGIDDVAYALGAALHPSLAPGCYDIPGPERVSHQTLLLRAARQMGRPTPLTIGVPVLTTRLSSYWIGWVTSVDLAVARELVDGLISDLDPSCPLLWDQDITHRPAPIDQAMQAAWADELYDADPSPPARARLEQIGHSLPQVA